MCNGIPFFTAKIFGHIYKRSTLAVQTNLYSMFSKEAGIKMGLQLLQQEINTVPNNLRGQLSDGYHTFDELYEFRKLYNAALFNEWAIDWLIRETQIKMGRIVPANVVFPKYDVHKSWRHYDGELCFGGGWFIVAAVLPTGQISNHYEAKDWDLFKIPETEKARFEFDGHTPADVITRLKSIL